jgi:pimeloyl-ACP methyl ester carboxylesterase
VVLPGRGDGLEGLRRTGIAQAIQAQWPDADVVLSGLAIGYYLQGGAIQRLHDEIVMPARTRGYREIWLLGASLGGLGALMYDGRWPGTVDGLVLLAPYLGEKPLLQEIAAAGGIAKWNPGPVPPQSTATTSSMSCGVTCKAGHASRSVRATPGSPIGNQDYLRDTMPSLAPLLPPSHVLVRDGRHAWTVWVPATREILAGIDADRRQRSP